MITLADIEGTSPLDPEIDDFSEYEVFVENEDGEIFPVKSVKFLYMDDSRKSIILDI